MARIEAPLETDARMGWKTYNVRVDGIQFSGVTEQTGAAKVAKLVEICEPRADEIKAAIEARDAATQANIDAQRAGGQGKERPAHKAWDRLINSLMKEAGIKDS